MQAENWALMMKSTIYTRTNSAWKTNMPGSLIGKEKGYQKKKAGLEKLRKFMFTYIVNSIYLFIFTVIWNLIF